jgi:hypothetical protein
MRAVWFKKCKTEEEKKSQRQTLLQHRYTLETLQEILESMLEVNPPSTDYDNPSWAYKQADRNGYNRALTKVLEIINLDKE